MSDDYHSAGQIQKAVTAHFPSEQLLPLSPARWHIYVRVKVITCLAVQEHRNIRLTSNREEDGDGRASQYPLNYYHCIPTSSSQTVACVTHQSGTCDSLAARGIHNAMLFLNTSNYIQYRHFTTKLY